MPLVVTVTAAAAPAAAPVDSDRGHSSFSAASTVVRCHDPMFTKPASEGPSGFKLNLGLLSLALALPVQCSLRPSGVCQ